MSKKCRNIISIIANLCVILGLPGTIFLIYWQTIRLAPYDVPTYIDSGNEFYKNGKYEQAIKEYNKAIQINPNHASVFYNRANAFRALRNDNRAIIDYDQALHFDKNFLDAYFGRGIAYANKNENGRAIEDFSQVIELNELSAESYYHRANVHIKESNIGKAIEDYTQAIELDSNYADAYTRRGLAYSGKGDYDRSVEDLNKALQLFPNADAHFNLAIAYEKKGDYELANREYDKAFQLDSDLKENKALYIYPVDNNVSPPFSISGIYSGTMSNENRTLYIRLVIGSIDTSNNIMDSYYMYYVNGDYYEPIKLTGYFENNTLKLYEKEENNKNIDRAYMEFLNFSINNNKITGSWQSLRDDAKYDILLSKE